MFVKEKTYKLHQTYATPCATKTKNLLHCKLQTRPRPTPIVGGIGSGTIEQFYASVARDIRNGKIKTPEEIAAEMRKHVPTDRVFQESFARASVARSYLARCLLSVLERQSLGGAGVRDAALAVGDEPERNDLEHVIPQKESPHWKIPEELRESLVWRIGNLALAEKSSHSPTRGDGFSEKKAAIYEKSSFQLTRRIADFSRWGAEEITKRQAELAALAVKAWPITVQK
jgi:hypothetical protein